MFSWIFGGKPANEISMDAGSQYTGEIKKYIDDEQKLYSVIDLSVSTVDASLGPWVDCSEKHLDGKWIRAVYFAVCQDNFNDKTSLFFGCFVECFIKTEKHGDIELRLPQTNNDIVYENISKLTGIIITDEMKNNAKKLYNKKTEAFYIYFALFILNCCLNKSFLGI